MPILSKGTDFTATEQVTSTKLDNLVDGADFTDTSGNAVNSASTTGTCVSGGGIEVTSGGQLQVKDADIAAAKLASNSVITAKILDANVTKAKIENLADYKVLGNVSGGAAAPAEVAILDEDTMSSDSATSLATQQSIKAYANAAPKAQMKANGVANATYTGQESVTLPNGLIMKMGISSSVGPNSSVTINFGTAFNAAPVSIQVSKICSIKVDGEGVLSVNNVSASQFTISDGADIAGQVYWFAIGR